MFESLAAAWRADSKHAWGHSYNTMKGAAKRRLRCVAHALSHLAQPEPRILEQDRGLVHPQTPQIVANRESNKPAEPVSQNRVGESGDSFQIRQCPTPGGLSVKGVQNGANG